MKINVLMKTDLLTRLKPSLVLSFLVCVSSQSFALNKDILDVSKSYVLNEATQQITIKGKVISGEDNLGIPGVNVTVKGVKGGVSTDFDGGYAINVSSPDAVLVFSALGFKTQEIKVGSQKTINVNMVADISTLNEVVVVAFGTQKRAVLTSAVDVVSSKAFEDRAVTNIGLALQGQTPGLVVTRTSSRPGHEDLNIKIRGYSSVNQGPVLYVVDGVPTADESSFLNLNSDDIESMTVLKDASAAIYGSRAANGVILVTTKKGKGKMKIDYSSNLRFTKNGITSYAASSQQYASLWLAANKEETTPYWWGWNTQENMEKMAAGVDGIYPTAFWGDVFVGKGNRIDEMFAQRYSYQHNLSISNRTDNSGFRLSLGYADNQGNLATAYDGQKQYNVRFNYDYKVSDRLKLETGISFIKTITSSPSVGLDLSLYAQDMPFFPAKNPYGQWNANFGNVGNRNSAAATSDGGRDDIKKLNSRIDFKATYNLLKGLDLEGVVAYQNNDYNQERYVLPVQLYDWYGNKASSALSSTIQSAVNPGYKTTDKNTFYQYYSGILRYNTTIGENHHISAFSGITAEHTQNRSLSGTRAFFTDLGVYDLNIADGSTQFSDGGKSQVGNYSYIGSFAYDYNEKYLVKVLGRIDGASQFEPGRKFKKFGTVELGWAFSKEDFLKDNSVLSFGKLRFSSGVSGNFAKIGDYDYLTQVDRGTAVFGQTPAVQTSSSLNNVGLLPENREWERVSQNDMGLDLTFFNNRLSFTYDYYIKGNKGMLVLPNVPTEVGSNKPPINNSGEFSAHGWETTISWKDDIKDFSYNISFNIGDTRNKIKNILNADSYGQGRYTLNGYPIDSWFTFKTDGYFKDQAEIDAYYATYAAGGQEMNRVVKGTASELRPGDIKRVDLNGDGMITGAGSKNSDVKYRGDSSPHYNFGLNLGCSYKGFDLGAFFQGVGQQRIMRSGYMSYPFFTISSNQPTTFLGKTWTVDNPDAEFPRLTTNGSRAAWNYVNNDFMLQTNTYIRLKSLIIGYTLPKSITNRAKLDRVRVYFSGNDLWEATTIKDGYDPEHGEATQNAGYPFYRTLSFGINVGL